MPEYQARQPTLGDQRWVVEWATEPPYSGDPVEPWDPDDVPYHRRYFSTKRAAVRRARTVANDAFFGVAHVFQQTWWWPDDGCPEEWCDSSRREEVDPYADLVHRVAD